jgi:phospholipase C
MIAAVMLAALGTTQSAVATRPNDGPQTATPIKHLVVIFPESISFDHYFGTYPEAANPPGEPAFHARPVRRPSTG